MGLEFTIWTLGGIILFLGAGIFSAEADSAALSIATFIIGLTVLEFGFQVPVIASIVAAPLLAAVYAIAYIAIGVIYTGVWRWPVFISTNGDKINREYEHWANNQRTNSDNSFDAFLDSDVYNYNTWDHKERLVTYVSIWPFSLIWELARKPAIWLFNVSWSGLGQVFQEIGRRAARSAHNNRK